MSPQPPPRVRRASRALAFGLVVFAIGLVTFAVSRLATGDAAAPGTSPAATSAAAEASSVPASPTIAPSPTPLPTPAPTVTQLIGQKLVVRMDDAAPSKALLDRVRLGEVGGVVLVGFGRAGDEALRAATKALRSAAEAGGQPPLLLMVAQEGGGARTLPWAPPAAPASRLGSADDADLAWTTGASTGRALAEAGVNVNLAPVMDVPGDGPSFLRDTLRTFSSDVDGTSRLALAFAEGLRSQGVVAAAKHFPGLGRAARSTDRYEVTVRTGRDALERDLAPFRDAIASGIPMIMLSNATYTALDETAGAGWSPAVATTLLRDELAFAGVSITDSLTGTAKARGVSAGSLAALAAGAGTDLLLIPDTEAKTAAVFDLLAADVGSGSLDRSVLEASYERILALKATLAD